MIDVSLSAGVDVGSTWLDLGFHPFARPIRARNSDAGIETIVAALRLRGVGKVALEAIGGYARKLVAALIEADLNVCVVNPRNALMRRRAVLSFIPGAGARISALAVVEMPELGAIDRKAAASLARLAPHPSQSGLSRGRNAIAAGRPCMRAAFYMVALVAGRHHSKFKEVYLALRAAGKSAKVALVAVARPMVGLANALIRDDMPFNNAAFA
jgi:transposase